MSAALSRYRAHVSHWRDSDLSVHLKRTLPALNHRRLTSNPASYAAQRERRPRLSCLDACSLVV